MSNEQGMPQIPNVKRYSRQGLSADKTTRANSVRMYTAIDLFAGCGGLSLGLENACFTPVFVNELNPHAMATYLVNRPYELGGMKFRDNNDLRCQDAHSLDSLRLQKLCSDLSNLQVGFRFEKESAIAGKRSTLDVLAGGPPCQGYSGIGIRRSYAVDRKEIPSNQLYQRMARVIDYIRPRIFLFENVRGLLNAKWTREGGELIWPDVLKEFRSIVGYEVRWKLVFAKDYGAPQNRPRVLLVGIRKDLIACSKRLDPTADPEDAVKCGFLPPPRDRSYPDIVDLLGDLVDPEVVKILRTQQFPSGTFETTRYPKEPASQIAKILRHPPHWAPDGMEVALTDQQYSKHNTDIVKKFDYMIAHDGEIPERFKTKKFSQRLLRPRWGNKEPNITTTSLPDDYVHFRQPRVLTVREWARLQLFPDWYVFKGKRTTGGIRRAGNPQLGIFDREVPKYTQIGNAIPVSLAEAVGHHFKRILDEALG